MSTTPKLEPTAEEMARAREYFAQNLHVREFCIVIATPTQPEYPRTPIQRKADQCEADAKLRAERTEALAREGDLITMKGV